ncbi:MAG: rhomboid family intramembrane serine protease [Solirubrobacteraceae bacterium]|nr:rhomboid family intramembrane serine protease [Solirubrobacteraceae bacterium]
MSSVDTQTCYRHPNRETAVSCSSCGNPICPDCMTPTPVGMRCPDCSKQRTEVRTARNLTAEPTLTYVLIAINVIIFLAEMLGGTTTQASGDISNQLSVWGAGIYDGELVGVSQGEWYRIVTGGFLHDGLLHVGFNMYLLWYLGQMMEPAIGKVRFGALYFVSLLGGSLGVMLLDPFQPTVGASGAVFGLIGAAVIAQRAQGIPIMQSGLGMLLLLNLVITFILPGISIGGHVGGLLFGVAAGYLLLVWAPNQRWQGAANAALGIVVALGFAAAVGAIWAAEYAVRHGALI